MEKARPQDIKKTIWKTYGAKMALQDNNNNNESNSSSSSYCAPGCCSGGHSPVQPATVMDTSRASWNLSHSRQHDGEGGKVIKFRGKSEKPAERMILFVCVENAGRSQMAEGFFNQRYAPKGYRAISAGTRPSSQINLAVVQAMKEIGIDITSSQKPKIITDDMIRSSEKSVNMGCIERAECPLLFINDVLDWGIEDPKGKPVERVREIRNEIERRVKEIAQSLQR